MFCLARSTSCVLLFYYFVSSLAQSLRYQLPLESRNYFNASYFDESINIFVKERSIPGLSVALTYDDRLIYASGFGYADKDSNLLVTTADRFRLASVSKSITAITVMYLVELGALNLSDRVFGDGSILGSTYSNKTYSDWELQITVQHLLEHTSGFVNDDMCGKGCEPTYLDKFLSLDQWQLIGALLDQYTPTYPPGTFASYSNFAYFIAGRVIESVAGVRPYENYVRDVILQSMGVTEMRIASDQRRANEVVYYDAKDPKAPYSFHVSRRDSVGAWIGTPIDLVKILTSIDGLSGRKDFLNNDSRGLLFQKSTANGSDFAKGFTVRKIGTHVTEAFKDGGYFGTNAYVNINILNKTSYAIAVNREIAKTAIFKGGHDLKTLMDNLTFGIDQWPEWDLFKEYST